jgi:DNA-binding MarR family transcriptional regulator
MFENAPPSAAEIRALAHQLLSWADRLSVGSEPGREMTEEDRHDLILGLAVATREARRLRGAIFPDIPFGNPDWDVMLDLFIQEMKGFRTSLDHLALTGDLSASTVYESVDTLVRHGLFERTPDRFDNRVVWLSLTVAGRQGLVDLFAQWAEFVRPAEGRIPGRENAEGLARSALSP